MTATSPVVVLNVLPTVLAHYERALVSELREVVGDQVQVRRVSIEQQMQPSRARRVARVLSAGWRLRAAQGWLVVAWPAFGIAEPILWRMIRRRGNTIVIVHDPLSLRSERQWPRPFHRAVAVLSRSPRVQLVTHSEKARHDLERNGWSVTSVVPHPVLVDDKVISAPSPHISVLVLGQFKAARDLHTLVELGKHLGGLGFVAKVRGRGWPSIEGWRVEDRFLLENELRHALCEATCVLVPYTRYYQSGVAVRALELGVPVVGRPTDFLVDLLGPTWPGLVRGVEATDWLIAIRSVNEPDLRSKAKHLARAAHARAIQSWSELLS